MKRQTVFAYAGLLFANICWGAGATVAKVTIQTFPPLLLSALQMLIATIILVIIQWRGGYPTIRPADRWPMAGLGIVMNVAGFIFGYIGIAWSLPSDISLLVIGEVIFTAILAYWLLKEHIVQARWVSLLVGTIGVVILLQNSHGNNTASAPNRLMGDLLFLADMLCCAYYTVQGGVFLTRNHTVSLMTYVNAVSLVFWGPVLIWYIASGQFPVVSTASIIGLVYLAVITSVVCIFLSFYAVTVIGATATTIVLFVQPLVGMLLGFFVMDDPITTVLLVGAVCVFASIALSMRASLREAHV